MDLQLQQRFGEGSKWLQLALARQPRLPGAGSGGGGVVALPSPTTTVGSGRGSEIDLEKGLHELEVEHIPTTRRRRTTDGDTDRISIDDSSSIENEKRGEEKQDEIHPPPAHKRPPLTLQTLPPEVQMLIVQHLQFGDIERLRRTCRHYHAFVSPRMVRTLFGSTTWRGMVERHCCTCLTYDSEGSGLLAASRMRRDYPFNAKCVDCAFKTSDDRLCVGRKINLGNGDNVWACRWCGWPITTPAAHSNAQFHRPCYIKYNDALLCFFLLGMLQFCLGVVAASLAWRYFRGEDLVFYPTVASFVLLWLTFFMLMFRGNKVRTYHYTLFLETAILGLWVAPVWRVSGIWVRTKMEGGLEMSTTASLVMFGFNMVFRLLNLLGNIILMCEYRRTRHHLPAHMIPLWRRVTNPVMDVLIFWTYPQSVEQKFPPSWT